MADIDVYLEQILSAVYGEEVRSSIHDAINAINNDVGDAVSAAITAQDSASVAASNAALSAEEAETIVSGAEDRITGLGNNMLNQLINTHVSCRHDLIEIRESVYNYDRLARESAEAAEADKDLAEDYMSSARTSANEARQYRDNISGVSYTCTQAADMAQEAAFEAGETLEQIRNIAADVNAFKETLRNDQAVYDYLQDSDGNIITDNNDSDIYSCCQFATGSDVVGLKNEIALLYWLVRRLEAKIEELTA